MRERRLSSNRSALEIDAKGHVIESVDSVPQHRWSESREEFLIPTHASLVNVRFLLSNTGLFRCDCLGGGRADAFHLFHQWHHYGSETRSMRSTRRKECVSAGFRQTV